jgi:hypothetical protein
MKRPSPAPSLRHCSLAELEAQITELAGQRLAALPSGGTKITYRAEVSGPDADELGPQISADFPQVLAALKVVAETDF